MRINNCGFQKKLYLCNANGNGSLTEWLGSGLQNRPQQFESAGNLFRRCENVGSLTEWLGSGLQNRPQQFESAGNLLKESRFHLKRLFISSTPNSGSFHWDCTSRQLPIAIWLFRRYSLGVIPVIFLKTRLK